MEINSSAATITKAAEKISKRAKLMEDGLNSQIETIGEESLKLKVSSDV